MTNVIDTLAAAAMRDDIPAFRAGDTLKVHVKVVEGNRSRVQVFQGVCIRVQGSGIGRTFTVRKVSFGVGVERTFPLHTPIIDKIEVVTRGDVRRAKLYYLRNLRGKAAKIKEKREADRRSAEPRRLGSPVTRPTAATTRCRRPSTHRGHPRRAAAPRRSTAPRTTARARKRPPAVLAGARLLLVGSPWCWRSSSRRCSCRRSTSRRRR